MPQKVFFLLKEFPNFDKFTRIESWNPKLLKPFINFHDDM